MLDTLNLTDGIDKDIRIVLDPPGYRIEYLLDARSSSDGTVRVVALQPVSQLLQMIQ